MPMLNKGATIEGIATSGLKLGAGMAFSQSVTGLVSATPLGGTVGDEIVAIIMGFVLAKYVDKEVGLGVALGGFAPIVQGLLGGIM